MDQVEKPWGNYRVLHHEEGVQVKRIELKPGCRFSLQRHARRSEKWTVVLGSGIVTLGSKEIPVTKSAFMNVPAGEIHRLQNTGSGPLVIIEVQLGDYLGEDDIVRLEDDFGRVS